MDKRGQVYLLVVLLLSFVVITLLVKVNYINKSFFEDDFEDLSENYKRESAVFLNLQTEKKLRQGILPQEIFDNFFEFTVDFTKYSKTQNPDFGLIYLFEVDGNLFVANYLDQLVAVYINDDSTAIVLEGCKSKISAGASFDGFGTITDIEAVFGNCKYTFTNMVSDDNIHFIIGDFDYTTTIFQDVPEIIIVSQEFKNEQRKVFFNEGFISGNKINIVNFCNSVSLPSSIKSSEICNCNARGNKKECEQLNSLGCVWNVGGCVNA